MFTRNLKTKAQLLELGFKVGGDPNSDYYITHNGKVVKSTIVSTAHPHGKAKTYRALGVYAPKNSKTEGFKPGTCTIVLEHVLIWVWYMGDIPDGMEIDHIDGCGQNNHLYNLRLVSHADNIKSGQHGRNQYTGGMTNEEIEAYRAKKAEEKAKTNIGKFGHKRGRPSKKMINAIKESK